MYMRRNRLYKIKELFCFLMMSGLTVCCVNEKEHDGPIDENVSAPYISLNFVMPAGSAVRGNPTGGEYGDGQENGQDYENEITSAVAFLYQGDNGVNSGGSTMILATVGFNDVGVVGSGSGGTDRVYATEPRQVELDNGMYYVLIVANPGADWWSGRTLTLNDVRNHIQTKAWDNSGTDYSNFLMTSSTDAVLILNSNTEKEPATTDVFVERMAARLDYKALNYYECSDADFGGATVELTGAAVVNNLTAGSYLMKRVAVTVGEAPVYLGDEKLENGLPVNYVIDPWTAAKTAANNSFTVGGVSGLPASALFGTWLPGGSEDPNWWAAYVQPGVSVSDGSEEWQRIGYTLENTTDAAEAGNRYSTEIVFKATFHPKGVANYADGETFFAIGSRIFSSMEDMMVYMYGIDFSFFDQRIEASASWTDIKTFAGQLLDNDPSGYKDFLLKQDETQHLESIKDNLKWKSYMLDHCGYSSEKRGGIYRVSLDQNGIVTRIALNPYNVRTYEDATCYYTWRVRHGNDNNDDKKGIMESAVVRNNIYKLNVTSIYSLGDEVPGEDNNIILDVYVNDWLLLDPETLPI